METPNEETATTLSSDWLEWVSTNLLAGETQSDIVQGLVEEGLGREEAKRLVEEIARSPIVRGAWAVSRRARRAEMILELERRLMRSLVIESRENLSADAFHRHYRAANRPVLLPDFTESWPARDWSLSKLAERFGDAPIQATEGRESDTDYDRNHDKHTYQTTVGEFITRMKTCGDTNDIYVVARDDAMRAEGLAPLLDDIQPAPGFFERPIKTGTALWLGPAGTVTPLHHDQSDILLSQLIGTKQVRLIAPSELAVADAARGLYGPPGEAFVSEERLNKVVVHDISLPPGQTLFIPMGWWHEVIALEPSVSIAINAFENSSNPWYAPGAV